MRGLRALCDKHGMLLILDEVQCGYGRTGKFFAYEWSGIDARHHGRGQGHRRRLPARRLPRQGEVAKSMVPGTHGSTYGGNPLACTIGNAVLDRILAPGFIEHVDKMGSGSPGICSNCSSASRTTCSKSRGKGLLAGHQAR